MKHMIFLAFIVMLTGCASMVNDTRQDIRVQTQSPEGQTVADAQCTLSNARETLQSASDSTIKVRRSGDDLLIRCTHPSYPDANARAISRVNKEMAGNAFFLFGVGAALDHNLGTGYTYPTWIRPVFGQSLIFDRRDEQGGTPVSARRDGGKRADLPMSM